MEDIQNLLKETIEEFIENGLDMGLSLRNNIFCSVLHCYLVFTQNLGLALALLKIPPIILSVCRNQLFY